MASADISFVDGKGHIIGDIHSERHQFVSAGHRRRPGSLEEHDRPDIAPWIDVPPTPPPKPMATPIPAQPPAPSGRSMSRPSFSSLASRASPSNMLRLGSRPSEPSTLSSSPASSSTMLFPPRQGVRGSDTSSFMTDSTLSLHSNLSTSTELAPPPQQIRKMRSAKNSLVNMFGRGKSRPPPGAADQRFPSPELPPSPTASTASVSTWGLKRNRKRSNTGGADGAHTRSRGEAEPPVPPVPPVVHKISSPSDIGNMDGIVDPRRAPRGLHGQPSFASFASTFVPGHRSRHSASSDLGSAERIGANGMFSNPWPAVRPSPAVAWDDGRVSPRSTHMDLPGRGGSPWGSTDSHGPALDAFAANTWEVPDSWATITKDSLDEHADAGSDDEADTDKRTRRRTTIDPAKHAARHVAYQLRIYRADSTFHFVNCAMRYTVAQLAPQLELLLNIDVRNEPHRLYIRERGRERELGGNERPLAIFRRRLEQAGYEDRDDLDSLGREDFRHLVTFVYKSMQLGHPAEDEDTSFEPGYEYVNLAGRGLRALPIALYVHAPTIHMLNLSMNPMIDIPRDFAEACTQLVDLKMSSMAIKKVPSALRHCAALNWLDLTCNRIRDLEDSGLEQLPGLASLSLENNRIATLPAWFPRLCALRSLNISNNKLERVPAVVCEMGGLQELDLSFNTITALPAELGQLARLRRLICVGNRIAAFPDSCRNLVCLTRLDCRRNLLRDVAPVAGLPALEELHADYNSLAELSLHVGPRLRELRVSHNDITRLVPPPAPAPHAYALGVLDLSHAKLSTLHPDALAPFGELQVLRLDHNALRVLPDTLGALTQLTQLSCSNNQLDALPDSVGRLQRLEYLEVNNNTIRHLPGALWNCASLLSFNATSNRIEVWHPWPVTDGGAVAATASPATAAPTTALAVPSDAATLRLAPSDVDILRARKGSTAGSGSLGGPADRRAFPPLSYSLERLYLGENKFDDGVCRLIWHFKELRVINLSFNDIQELPPSFFRPHKMLEQLYLSGNKLSTFPVEFLERADKLTTLFLNGNRLQTLPAELGKLTALTTLDVGSNQLKYNINNPEYDWNWNMSPNLRYLNLSGNKRLEIKPAPHSLIRDPGAQRRHLADFDNMLHLRMIGLMDVMTTFMENIPAETIDRRVRTTPSDVGNMTYGIADMIDKAETLSMFDLVVPQFRAQRNEFVFAMFGRAQSLGANNRLAKFLHEHFAAALREQLTEQPKLDGIPDALRRTFLALNKHVYEHLNPLIGRKGSVASTITASDARKGKDDQVPVGGASGIAVYLVDRIMFVANVGNALAVVSRAGQAMPVSKQHDPWDRDEAARIRSAEGWISPTGLTNGEIDLSRSFGYYKLAPMINCCPAIHVHELDETDDFLIIANRGLWDYVSFQTAVDIARAGENANPMIAAQKLRDLAISYGAGGSIMIMVVNMRGLFKPQGEVQRRHTRASLPELQEMHRQVAPIPRTGDAELDRLGPEIDAPTGHVPLVFTDIRNSTMLWETNGAMQAAHRIHNRLLRRWLRLCGGYEVKTEGDAFMCSFQNVMSALHWCLRVQVELLSAPWPQEILDSPEGREVYDADGKLVARGLSVRMGIHSGNPSCEPDVVTGRMDYFGPMVNRTARITGQAGGGQISISMDVLAEIEACIRGGRETEYTFLQPPETIAHVRHLQPVTVAKGAVQLKGIENAEYISFVYPASLATRETLADLPPEGPVSARPRLQFRPEQLRELGVLAVRLEALASARVFRPVAARKGSTAKEADEEPPGELYLVGDPDALVPAVNAKASEAELLALLDSLSVRVENALASLTLGRVGALPGGTDVLGALQRRGGVSPSALERILAILNEA